MTSHVAWLDGEQDRRKKEKETLERYKEALEEIMVVNGHISHDIAQEALKGDNDATDK